MPFSFYYPEIWGAILTVLAASLADLPVPFAPVHLLFINLLTDSLPAIALGLEPASTDVMDEQPRPSEKSFLSREFLSKVVLEGAVIGTATMFLTVPLLSMVYLYAFCSLPVIQLLKWIRSRRHALVENTEK